MTTEIAGAGAAEPTGGTGIGMRRRIDPWAHPEVTAATVLMGVLLVTLIVVIGQMRTVNLDPSCLRVIAAQQRSGFCLDHGGWTLRELEAGLMRVLRVSLAGAPILVGALLGAPVVARSLEERRFAADWATPPARVLRLAPRVLRRAVLAFVGLALCGWLAAEVQWQMTPWLPRGAAPLDTFGTWGAIVPARGLAVLALAVLVGTIVGHRLVAGAVAVVLGFVLVVGGSAIMQRAWVDAYPAVVAETPLLPGDILVRTGSRWRNPYGTLLTEQQLRQHIPFKTGSPRYEEAIRGVFTEVPVIIPMSALPDLERTELLATLGVSVVLVMAAGVAVTVRRPRS